MLKQTIKYTDFNGVPQEQEFYFNLTKAEITAMELSTKGGLVEKINTMTQAKDGEQMIKFVQDFILRSYGEKTPDGQQFRKSPEISQAFSWTMAYDALFMKLCTDPDAMAAFVNGVVPQDLANQ